MKEKTMQIKKSHIFGLVLILLITVCGLLFLLISDCFDNKTNPATSINVWHLPPQLVINEEIEGDRINRKDFSRDKLIDLQSLKTKSLSMNGVSILDITQNPESGRYLAISDTSELFSFTLEESSIESVLNFGHQDLLSAMFTNNSELMLLQYIDGGNVSLSYEIRDVVLGDKIEGYSNEISNFSQIFIDPSGTYVIQLSDEDNYTTLIYTSLKQRLLVQPDLHLASEKDNLSLISSVSGDQYGEYLAVAFTNGKVIIGNIEWGDFLNGGLIINDLYNKTSIFNTQSLTFSYDNQYLVWLTENRIFVWKINKNKSMLILNEDIVNGNCTAVDRSGKWLAVGTENSIVFFDLENQYDNYIIAGEAQATSPVRVFNLDSSAKSIFFSLDNTMLIWGDNEGKVHVWGEEW